MLEASVGDGQAGRERPGASGRIVQFRTRERLPGVIETAGDQNLAVRQKNRAMGSAGHTEVIRGRPGAGDWIIEFRARSYSARHQHLAVG